jgi:hypothetical protein
MNMPDTVLEKRTVLVYEPHAEESVTDDPIAQRAPNLNGAVIGLLDNTKDLADKILDEVKTLLQKDFPQTEFRVFRKKSVSGAEPDMIEKLATCNAVVTAVGD